jgi:DNA-binding FadR family transcriptional regulator
MNVLAQITPVQRLDSNRAEEISARLEQIIAESGLRAGDGLGTKEDLRCRFQVSPAPMNEALRILESRGVIATRRGLNGGVFVSNLSVQIALKQVVRALRLNAVLREYCGPISMQLQPLIVAEAIKNANVKSIAELNALVSGMTLVIDDPIEVLARCRSFYGRIAEMGSNPLLTAIYTALLDTLDQQNGHHTPGQLIAECRRIVEVIDAGDTTPRCLKKAIGRDLRGE